MNMFKKNGGFTLVELIVVIAILAILAVVAIPAYSGYIAKANDTACLSELTAIQSAAQASCSLEGAELEKITIDAATAAIDIDSNIDDVEGMTAKISENFRSLYTDSGKLLETLQKHSNYETASSNGIEWTATGWDLLAD